MIVNEVTQAIRDAIRSGLGVSEAILFSVQAPEHPEHGDYATNAAMVLAKTLGKRPMQIAEELKPALLRLGGDLIESVEIAKPGFINIRLKHAALVKLFADILKNPEVWGESSIGNNKTVIVEYFQLNIAKRPHIGHLRSAVIGDALKRMLRASGYHAISDTHVGDWGTQFGILLLGFKEGRDHLEDIDIKTIVEKGDPFDELQKLYVQENDRISKDAARRELAKAEFAKLEHGDEENRKIWQWMVDVSMKKLAESVARLELLPFDEHNGESAYEKMMPPIVEEALQKGVAKKLEDGAVIVDLTDDKLDEAVLIKSDGASTYLLRDLATITYRKDTWRFWKNLYVVDVRQSHHFKQLFRVAELLGFEGVGESEHIPFGFMKLPEGKLSTREGNVISLEAVMDEAVSRAREVIRQKNPDLEHADKVAETVGIGAIKYFDLSHNRMSDVVFRWDDALAFEGNTGPYIQYTHARLRSILRKAGSDYQIRSDVPLDDGERLLLFTAIRFPEAIGHALESWSPHLLAFYLYELAHRANEFYHSHPVMQEPDARKRELRLALVSGVAATLKQGLCLLGIEAPEEM